MDGDSRFHYLKINGGKLHETVCLHCSTRLAVSPRLDLLRIVERLHACNGSPRHRGAHQTRKQPRQFQQVEKRDRRSDAILRTSTPPDLE
jgi:hypothetical protein